MRVADGGRIELAGDAVFGTEDCCQLHARRMSQHVGRALAARIDTGLVGDQADFDGMRGIGMEFAEAVGLKHVDPGLDFAIARVEAMRGHQRLVVAGDAGHSQLVLLGDGEVEARSDGGCNSRSQGNHRVAAARMHGVGEKNDVGVGDRVNPQRCAGEAGVAEGTDGEQFAAVGGKGRVDVPSEPAQTGRVGRLLRSGHLVDRRPAEHGEPAEEIFSKAGQVVAGREQPGMTRHASHAARRGIVHRAAQHLTLLVVLSGRDAGRPLGGRQKTGVFHAQRGVDVGGGKVVQADAGHLFNQEAEDLEVDVAINEARAGRIGGLCLHGHFEGRVAALP